MSTEVYIGDELFGTLRKSFPEHLDVVRIAYLANSEESWSEPEHYKVEFKNITLRKKKFERRFTIPEFQIDRNMNNVPDMLNSFRRKHSVPDTAKCTATKLNLEMATLFTFEWSVLVVEKDQAELVFDLDIFEPA